MNTPSHMYINDINHRDRDIHEMRACHLRDCGILQGVISTKKPCDEYIKRGESGLVDYFKPSQLLCQELGISTQISAACYDLGLTLQEKHAKSHQGENDIQPLEVQLNKVNEDYDIHAKISL